MFAHIRTKILALFVLNVVVWLTFLGVIFYWIASRSLENQLEDSLKATSAVLASQWDGSLLIPLKSGMENTALYQSFQQRLQRLKHQTDLDSIHIASADRMNILSTERNLRIGQPLPRLDILGKQLEEALSGRTSASLLIRVEDRYYKSALAPIYSQNQVVAVLIADISPHYLSHLQTFRNSIFLFTAIALLFCIFSAHLFSRTITTPISSMVKGVEEISKAHYEQPLILGGSDELSHLATSIEHMRQNILHRDTQMKMMLSGIAHEIRNPLGGIELFAGILAKEKLEPEQRAYMERIQSEIQNLKKLLNEFLDFARPRILESEDISMPHLLSEIETLFSEEIHHKGAKWILDVQPGIETIQADRSKLKQALLNLYKNAFQALPSSDGEVQTKLHKNGTGVLLEISNTQRDALGAETCRRIFEPFFTTKEKGMGLGLPLAKGIIEAHGGELKLIENESTKITFAVRLPQTERPAVGQV